MSDQPNIVLIFTDQWRGDCLSSTHHPVVHTPYLDELAARGTRFDKGYSATPICIPARAGLLTGQSHKRHGRIGYQADVSFEYPVTMAGELSKAGYQTQAIGKMHVDPERRRMGFDNVILHDGHLPSSRAKHPNPASYDDYHVWLKEQTGDPHADYFDHGIFCNSCLGRPWDKEERLHPTNWVTNESIKFLDKRDTTDPFFLFMSYHRPHPPYDPPQPYFDMYMDMDLPDPVVGDWASYYEFMHENGLPDAFAGINKPEVLRRAMAGYYGLMTHIDHQLNRFFYELHQRGMMENTWICFSADHGEMMGDHHLYRKSLAYEGSARVPFIVVPPKWNEDGGAKTTDALAELRDFGPTFLDIAGAEIPEQMDGKSLLPILKDTTHRVREHLHSETVSRGGSYHAIITEQYKYIWMNRDLNEQLFDLRADAHELKDLSKDPAHERILKKMRELLIEELKDREEGFVKDGELVTAEHTPPCMRFVYENAGM